MKKLTKRLSAGIAAVCMAVTGMLSVGTTANAASSVNMTGKTLAASYQYFSADKKVDLIEYVEFGETSTALMYLMGCNDAKVCAYMRKVDAFLRNNKSVLDINGDGRLVCRGENFNRQADLDFCTAVYSDTKRASAIAAIGKSAVMSDLANIVAVHGSQYKDFVLLLKSKMTALKTENDINKLNRDEFVKDVAKTVDSVYALGAIMGDVNGDGIVTLQDVSLLNSIVLGKKSFPADVSAWVGDVNCDGRLNSTDALCIQKTVMGVK